MKTCETISKRPFDVNVELYDVVKYFFDKNDMDSLLDFANKEDILEILDELIDFFIFTEEYEKCTEITNWKKNMQHI